MESSQSDNASSRLPFVYKAGETVGSDYILEDLLGRGGSGVVFKARHKHLNQHFAIKILTAELTEEKSWQRFQREVQTLVKLNHPNIVRVYNMGIDREKNPFCVMELLNGPTLAQVIKAEQFLFAGEAIEYILAVSKALEAAHKAKIIHRDIKPGNIVLMQVGDGENKTVKVKLVDFGLARLVDDNINLLKAAERSKQSLTEKGEVFGSPLYMSPEQCRGQDLDHRTDIYSLGCSFFEALTGQVPFHGKNVVQTFQMHESAPVPALAKVNKEGVFPEELEHVVRRMLEKEPDKRYQNMDSVIHDLERIQFGKPVKSTLQEVRDSAFRTSTDEDSSSIVTGSSGQTTSFSKKLVSKQGLVLMAALLIFTTALSLTTFNFILNPIKPTTQTLQMSQNSSKAATLSTKPEELARARRHADFANFKIDRLRKETGKYARIEFPPCFESCSVTDADGKFLNQLQNRKLNPFYVKLPITFEINALNVPPRCLEEFEAGEVDCVDLNFMNTREDWLEIGQVLRKWGHIGFIRISASVIPKAESDDHAQSYLNQIPDKPTMSVSITHCQIPHKEMEYFSLPTHVLFYKFTDNSQDIKSGSNRKEFDATTILRPVLVHKNIRSLRLGNLVWTQNDYDNILKLSDLETFELNGIGVTAEKILALKKLKRLSELHLRLDDTSAETLKAVAELRQLKRFYLTCPEEASAARKSIENYYAKAHVSFHTYFLSPAEKNPVQEIMKDTKDFRFLENN